MQILKPYSTQTAEVSDKNEEEGFRNWKKNFQDNHHKI